MHNDGIVIVDDERAQRRLNVLIDGMPADGHNVERARTSGQEVWSLQLRHSLWKAVARSQYNPAGRIETPHQRRQCNCSPDTTAAITATLEAVARRDHK